MTVDEIGRKRVLIIAYYFPPAGGVGTFRVTKYVKYLRKFGWEPVVITARETAYSWLDSSLESNIPPDIHVFRLPVCGTHLIDDKGIRWIPYLLRSLRSIIKNENPAVVYLTGGPFMHLILGPLIKRCFKIPYVIDLRDPWKLRAKPAITHGIKPRGGELLIRVMEPLVIRHAHAIICATEPMCRAYIASYKNEPSGKFVTVTNGYDPEDFEHIEPMRFAEFTIVYTGKWYPEASKALLNSRAFFTAMKAILQKRQDIHLVHIGILEPEIVGLAQSMGIGDNVVCVGPRSYKETLAYAKGADLLLLIGGGRIFELPAKMFDYLACKRPILALAPRDGAIAEVVTKTPFARIVDSQNPTEIANVIDEAYKGELQPKDETYSARLYEREHLTGLLASVLDQAISSV